jgi:3-phenylpropionate/trans-cinnamate dioxygenase ferredoxin subunit
MSGRTDPPRHVVARLDELPPGSRKIVELEGRSIGVFNVNGQIVAVLNLCPHEFAPVCLGRVSGTTLPSAPGRFEWGREGEILSCPWHGWEFDLLSGACLTDKRRLHHFAVTVEADTVYVTLRKRRAD